MSEEWRALPGYEGRYEVSNQGQIKSFYRRTPRLLNPWLNKGRGYLYASLHDATGHRRSVAIHQIVMLAFVGPLPVGYVTRHLDGNPLNNNLDNLRYGTYSENEQDKVRHGGNHNASKTHCIHGHEFTPENTERWGHLRGCRACRRARARAQHAAAKA